jgi:hypothetical protein
VLRLIDLDLPTDTAGLTANQTDHHASEGKLQSLESNPESRDVYAKLADIYASFDEPLREMLSTDED